MDVEQSKYKFNKYKQKINMLGGTNKMVETIITDINNTTNNIKFIVTYVDNNEKSIGKKLCDKLCYIGHISLTINNVLVYNDNKSYLISTFLFDSFVDSVNIGDIFKQELHSLVDCEENTKAQLNELCLDNDDYHYVEGYVRKYKCIVNFMNDPKIVSNNKYVNFIKFIMKFQISNDYNLIIKNKDIFMTNISDNIPKYIPSHINVDEIEFKNDTGFVTLGDNNEFDIVFDSGNDFDVVIGEMVYRKMRQLNIINYESDSDFYNNGTKRVKIIVFFMKFTKRNATGKIYKVTASTGNNIPNEISFSNEFMKNIFNDGYSIKHQYDKNIYINKFDKFLESDEPIIHKTRDLNSRIYWRKIIETNNIIRKTKNDDSGTEYKKYFEKINISKTNEVQDLLEMIIYCLNSAYVNRNIDLIDNDPNIITNIKQIYKECINFLKRSNTIFERRNANNNIEIVNSATNRLFIDEHVHEILLR